MKFFIVASLLAFVAAEPVMDTPSVQAAKVAHHAAVVHDTAVHMQAKANAAMYKAHVPHVYTHQAPYVYNYNPVVYKAPEVKAPAVTYTAPVTYTQQVAPVVYTNVVKQTPAQDRKVEQPAVTYAYPNYPVYKTPVTYTKTVNPVVYKAPVPVTYA